MRTYLERTDPEALVDYPPADPIAAAEIGMTELCPKCKGYGGWNLRLNAYPLHQYEDTPENRHKFSHFTASCDHCVGWGYVRPEDSDHVHEWKRIRSLGNCLHLDECQVCGKQWQVDSSG
jgi:hypothetical protein